VNRAMGAIPIRPGICLLMQLVISIQLDLLVHSSDKRSRHYQEKKKKLNQRRAILSLRARRERNGRFSEQNH
jgi:hypothetical protein